MDERDTLKIGNEGVGEVRIANEVLATIAGISALEIEGVDSLAGGFTDDLAGKFGVKNYTKGVKVEIEGSKATIMIAINMKYGYNIPEVSKKVQEKIVQAVDMMTGLEVTEVDIRIAGVAIDETNK